MVYVMYNDEKPTGQKTEHFGHTKGMDMLKFGISVIKSYHFARSILNTIFFFVRFFSFL